MKLIYGKFIFLTFFLLTIMLTSYAAQPIKPLQCPATSTLQSIHLQTSDFIETKAGRWECCTASGYPYYVDGTWTSRKFISNYGTKDQWEFQFSQMTANNSEQALQAALKDFSILSFEYGPTNELGHWYCSYRSLNRRLVVWYLPN